MPKISIIIPVYNRAKVLRNTLDAIAVQTFNDWECLLVDDLSTDNSWEILTEYVKKDKRFVALKNERQKGACGARNTGIKHARGEYFQFFDSDDKMYQTMLESLIGEFEDGIDVVTCWTNVVDVDTNEPVKFFENISEGNIHDALMTGKTYVDTNCGLIRRNAVEAIGGWSEDCPSFQEWDFHIRLSRKAKYKTLKKHLIDYYWGGSDTISKSLPKWVSGKLYILTKYKNEFLFKYPKSYITNLGSVYGEIKKDALTKGGLKNSKLWEQYNEKTNPIIRRITIILYNLYMLVKNGNR